MLMADNSSQNWLVGELFPDDDDANDRLCFDLETLWDMIDETPATSQNNPENLEVKIESQGLPVLDGPPPLKSELLGSDPLFYSYNSEALDSRAGNSEGSFNSEGMSIIFDCAKQEPPVLFGSPFQSFSVSPTYWNSQKGSTFGKDYQYKVPAFSEEFSFAAGDTADVSDTRGILDPKNPNGEAEYLSQTMSMENSDISHGTCSDFGEGISKSSGTQHMVESAFVPMDLQSACHSQSSTREFPKIDLPDLDVPFISEFCNQYPIWEYSISTESPYCFGPSRPSPHYFGPYVNNAEMMVLIKDEEGGFPTQSACLNSTMNLEDQVERAGGAVSAASATGNSVITLNDDRKGANNILPSYNSSEKADFGFTLDEASSKQNFPHTLSKLSRRNQTVSLKDEKEDELLVLQGTSCQSFITVDDLCDSKSAGVADGLFSDKGLRQSLSGIMTSNSSKNHMVAKDKIKDVLTASKRLHHSLDKDDAFRNVSPVYSHLQASEQNYFQPLDSIGNQLAPAPEVSCVAVQSSTSGHISHVVDDSDICILENLSKPACLNQYTANVKPHITSQRSSIELRGHMGVGGLRHKTNDERSVYRVALQDLAQPKTEATPPDVLTVPLLRHQRIALSWMVQKETNNIHCCGGILADDQGLGKTISTIALILKEKPPPSRVCTINNKQAETLNLDDDDGVSELNGMKQGAEGCQIMANRNCIKDGNTLVPAKGRPAGGTLVVCPTSVLRQWSDELHNKVASKANLSVLTYHGGNRTKDSFELAKYDVVLTTYSIVSMEVPKKPLVDEDDDETRKRSDVPPMGLPSSKKRKYPPSSGKRSSKSKKGMDSELFESTARPLAQVAWFRVVLDEAQSIKNHKTQVARACWGLRAKRRWCLSGTPIQNAIDDLYSYFRFLRYDPYAAYKYFCSKIKVPIQRNPINGYKKLQAVLKTVMLRRTKGTLLDGEPIINLPPKTIELKKVEFTMEEREFYCGLEADSRAQFAKYAAAGTVKQNYVNILLMLLRLRQACDHPLLVRGCSSNSAWTSSVETANKLSTEKQTSLLNCLEASLAICGICNDPPEDAVVTSCGHVFCNQCISEHLSGDDNECPTTSCKCQLNLSSFFSRATLRSSLSEGQESKADYYASVLAETLQPCSSAASYESSKIKAALEVLQSLSRPRPLTPKTSSLIPIDGGAHSTENLSRPLSEGMCTEMQDSKGLRLDTDSKNLVKVVGEKAIVFSQWTRMLDLLEASLKNSSIEYRRLDGTMSVVARDKAVKDFNNQPEVSVMIMSLKAASLGLNMVAACRVLLLDLWWNPTTEDQAIDRAHRIGQTRPVTVLRLTVKDTVEDRILALQQKKREMVSSAFGEDETGSCQTRLTVEDLNYLFS